jgi:hypothetical protein
MSALDDLAEERSGGRVVRGMCGSLLIFRVIWWRVEESKSEVNREDLRMGVLLGQMARVQ